MRSRQRQHVLPRRVDTFLSTLSKHYKAQGKEQQLAILANARVEVHEETSIDNWNGGTYGHTVELTIPGPLFLAVLPAKAEVAQAMLNDLNSLHNEENEHFDAVQIEVENAPDPDWQLKSGARIDTRRSVSTDSLHRIWGAGAYRVFLSHKSEVKKDVAQLKSDLALYGAAGFVAHEDIEPTKEWQEEIENALASMDAFVAILTERFHDSNWTDQEVGYAVGRGIPVISLRLGKDPYGFIGKFQALACDWKTAPQGIVQLLLGQDRMVAAFVRAVRACPSFDQSNRMAELLVHLKRISRGQADELAEAFNNNSQVREAYGFNGGRSSKFGEGLVSHLNRLDDRKWKYGKGGQSVVPVD